MEHIWSDTFLKEDLLNKGYIEVKEVPSISGFDKSTILFSKWIERKCYDKKEYLDLIYWDPESQRIISNFFYSVNEIEDIEDSLNTIEKIFKFKIKDIFNLISRIVKKKLEE